MPIKWKNISVPDAINLVVGACLFASPWIFDFWSDPATQNAWYMGAIVALVATMELAQFEEWAEWVNLTVGLWVLAAAGVLNFEGQTIAMLVHLLAGSVVTILAAIRLYAARVNSAEHQHPLIRE